MAEGRVIIMTGATGTGKTTNIKEIISQIPLPKYFIDKDGEYKEFNSYWVNGHSIKKAFASMKNMLKDKENYAAVFSEAGIYMTHNEGDDEEMREILKSARRRGGWLCLDFHGLSEVPLWTLKYCNYLYIKKTVMESASQLKKWKDYPEIMEARKFVQESENNFETIIINPRNLRIDL